MRTLMKLEHILNALQFPRHLSWEEKDALGALFGYGRMIVILATASTIGTFDR